MPHKNTLCEDLIAKTAKAYHDYLVAIAKMLKKDHFYNGLEEGLRKFPSNYYISRAFEVLPKTPLWERLCPSNGESENVWYGKRITDYYSENAYKKLKNGDNKGLSFEHMIPKASYQNAIVNVFRQGKTITFSTIEKILKNQWFTATITEQEENKLLTIEVLNILKKVINKGKESLTGKQVELLKKKEMKELLENKKEKMPTLETVNGLLTKMEKQNQLAQEILFNGHKLNADDILTNIDNFPRYYFIKDQMMTQEEFFKRLRQK